MKKKLHICVDMDLPPWMRLQARKLALNENPENGGKVAIPTQKKWLPGRVLRVRFMDGIASVQAKVQNLAIEWAKFANIGFEFGNDPNAEIRVSFAAGPGSWSFMGTDNLSIPKSQATMNFGWLTPSTSDAEYGRVVRHEFGHALGLIHEHQHPKAGIPWDKPVVYEYYMRTQGWTKAEVDVNLFQKYDISTTQFSEYDPKSIMHYAVDDSLTIGTFSVGWNTDFSETDKKFIGTVYPGLTNELDLVVGGAPTKASIGAHGEQDVYRLSIPKKGVYTIETQGKTDVFMSLFNDDGTMIAEDDDSGPGYNSRIVSTLKAGSYTVRIRHYQPKGTGDYSVSIKAA